MEREYPVDSQPQPDHTGCDEDRLTTWLVLVAGRAVSAGW